MGPRGRDEPAVYPVESVLLDPDPAIVPLQTSTHELHRQS